MVSRTYNEQRFSPLNQIPKANVGQLRMAWTRGLPARTQESTQIFYRGVMYLFAPSDVLALTTKVMAPPVRGASAIYVFAVF